MSTFGKIGARPLVKPPFVELRWLQGDGASGFWIPCDVNLAKFEVSFYRSSLNSEVIAQNAYRGSEVSNVDVNIRWDGNGDTLSRGAIVTQHMSNQNTSATYSSWFYGSAQLTTKLTMAIDIAGSTNTFSVGGGGVWPSRSYNSLPFIGLMCCAKSNNAVTNFSTVKICSFKIWESGSLTHNLIPVRVGKAGCLFNEVNGSILRNAGTGNFVLGPDKA